MNPPPGHAFRAKISGSVQGLGFRAATSARAHELEISGWVRNRCDGSVEVHAEGRPASLRALRSFLEHGPPGALVEAVEAREVAVEGHEQFAVRGVSAGAFLVKEHAARTRHFDFRLELDGVMRSWAVPRGPSLDPAAKRLAVEVPDHEIEREPVEGRLGKGAAIAWDRGSYEQGGRVAWPQALERGHAVFVLHGEKLRGGFALQRTGAGAPVRWLLVKRRDDYARPGSDIVAESPASVLSGKTLEELLAAGAA